MPNKQWIYVYFYEFASEALHTFNFENFLKWMTSCLSELNVTPSFYFAFKIPGNVTATSKYSTERQQKLTFFLSQSFCWRNIWMIPNIFSTFRTLSRGTMTNWISKRQTDLNHTLRGSIVKTTPPSMQWQGMKSSFFFDCKSYPCGLDSIKWPFEFCTGPNILGQTKNWILSSTIPKLFVWHLKLNLLIGNHL